MTKVSFLRQTYQQPLPMRNFRHLDKEELLNFDVMSISDYSDKGYLIEVSLSYLSYLHDEHNCFPLAPVKRSIRDEELSPYAKEAWKELRGKSKRLLRFTLPKFKIILTTRIANKADTQRSRIRTSSLAKTVYRFQHS